MSTQVGEKRGHAADMQAGQLVQVKKSKSDQLQVLNDQQKAIAAVPRSSNLAAPIMLLEGQEGDINCGRFHPSGQTLASAGFDRLIYLWNVYGDCENFAVLKGHKGAILDMHFTVDGSTLMTSSSDKTAACWDYETGGKVKKMAGHQSYVNACCPARRGPELIAAASDDCTVKLWDRRKKAAVQTFQSTYPVTSVCFNDTATQIISAGIDNLLKIWD